MNREDGFSVRRTAALALPLLVLATAVVVLTDVQGAAPSGDLSIFHESSFLPAVPSSIVMGLFVPLLLLSAAVPALRRRWQVTRGELVAVYCMLLLAVPVLGAGFWHRFPGMQLEIPRMLQLDRAMSISPRLWPHGTDVLAGASVEDPPAEGAEWSIFPVDRARVMDSPGGGERCLAIVHESDEDTTRIALALDRTTRRLVPARRHAICARMRLDEPGPRTVARIEAGARPGKLAPVGGTIATATRPTLLAPDRFVLAGALNFELPHELGDQIHLAIVFSGAGTLYVRDVSMLETEVVFRYFEGYEQASPQVYDELSEGERALVVRSPGGWRGWLHALGGRVPWRFWARPLAVWGMLVIGTFMAMFCMVTLFYRQWQESERLAFPLQTFVLDMTAGDGNGRLAILRSTPFWIGLGACVVYLFLQQMNTQFPQIPALRFTLSVPDLLPPGPLRTELQAGKGLTIDFRPAFVAVAFLMSLEMSLSLIVFFFIGMAFRIIGALTPLRTFRPGLGRYSTGEFPFDSMLTTGALLFMACACVFAARRHLKNVLRLAVLGARAPDDADAAMRYRRAVLGLVAAALLLLGFAVASELNPAFVLVYMGILLVLALLAARIRAETGLPHLAILPMHPQYYLIAAGGALVFGFREVVFNAQAAFLYLGGLLMLAPILAESMAAATRTGVPMNKMNRCLVIAFVTALVLGGVVYLTWAYTAGAANLHPALASSYEPFRNDIYNFIKMDDRIDQHFRVQTGGPDRITPENAGQIAPLLWPVFVITGISFAITGLLALARVIWLGFPLHPLGFALAFTPAVYALWPSIAAGHLVKRLGLRFGGLEHNRRVLRPFFVGLFAGDLLSLAAWRIVETLAP